MFLQKDFKAASDEALILQRLTNHNMKKHPNVVRYVDSFRHEKTLCIVMEYCEQGDLHSEIKERKANQRFYCEDEIMETFVQILCGLAHIHGQRMIHRDLKTQNIFIGAGGEMKVGDLGIARVLEQTLEQCQTVVGTPYYMAPEVCQSVPYSSKADMWSLGCVLYELCTLRHAFSADSLYSLIFRIIQGDYDAIDEAMYTPQLSSIVARLLDKDPQKRPSCQELLRDSYVRVHIERIKMKTMAGHLSRTTVPRQTGAGALNRMSAAERLRLKKQEEHDMRRREIEHHVQKSAQENAHRSVVADRKARNLQGSIQGAGLAFGFGAHAASPRQSGGGGSDDMVNYGTIPRGGAGDDAVVLAPETSAARLADPVLTATTNSRPLMAAAATPHRPGSGWAPPSPGRIGTPSTAVSQLSMQEQGHSYYGSDASYGAQPYGGIHCGDTVNMGSTPRPPPSPAHGAYPEPGQPVRFGMDTASRDSFVRPSNIPRAPMSPSTPIRFGQNGSLSERPVPPTGAARGGPVGVSTAAVRGSAAQMARDSTADSCDYTSDDYSSDDYSTDSLEGASDDERYDDARADNQVVYDNLRHALSGVNVTTSTDDVIVDEPPPALAMTKRSQNYYEHCKLLLGSAFERVNAYCRSQYSNIRSEAEFGGTQRRVRSELLGMIDLPPAQKQAAITSLEVMFFNEYFKAQSAASR